MNVSSSGTLLIKTDSGESEVSSMPQDLESPRPVDGDINGPSSGVGAVDSGRTNVEIVLRATVATVDLEGKPYLITKGIQSIYRDGDHFVLLTPTATGELLKLEIFPSHGVSVIKD